VINNPVFFSKFFKLIEKYSRKVKSDDVEMINHIFKAANKVFSLAPINDQNTYLNYITACRSLLFSNQQEIFDHILDVFNMASEKKLMSHEICNTFMHACLMMSEYDLAKIAIRKHRDCIPEIVTKETDFKSKVDLHGLGHAVALLALIDYLETSSPPYVNVITGIGSREDNYLAMRNFIENNLSFFNPCYHIAFEENNQGILYLSKRELQVELHGQQSKRLLTEDIFTNTSDTRESKRMKAEDFWN
jgi:hypothetical protein